MSSTDTVNILVVDDQRAHLLSYEVILSDLGHNVICAGSGIEALQALMDHDFAAILLDVNMPRMDGFELATMIHQHPRFEKTPIIFVSALHLTDLDRLKGYELGAIDYIHAPVIPSILRGKLSVLVELYVKRRELQRLNDSLARANTELAQANSTLQAEKARELMRLNQTLEFANDGLARANQSLQAEVAERRRTQSELAATKDDLALQVEALTRIHELAMYLAGARDLPSVLEHVLKTVLDAHGAERGLVSLFDASSGSLVESASVGFDAAQLQGLASIRPTLTSGACGSAFATGSRVVIEDIETDPRFDDYREVARALGFRAVHTTPIITVSGETLGVISVHFAVARKPTPREMQVADMCARYAAETIETSKNQGALRENARRLREADHRKDEFLATLAHELRNPLAPIRDSLHILRLKGAPEAGVGAVLDIIERQVSHMVRLVDDLLEVSRITRGKIDLALEHVDLASVLRAAVETSMPLIEAGRHELVVSLPEGPTIVQADSVRLCQVFANLLNNSAKYTQRAGHISLTAEHQGDSVIVSVRDDGVGIPEDMLSRVFDMFTQIDRTLGRAQGGLGIGLALVKRLVEMHHGCVEARSPGLGKGSEFRVTLPLDRFLSPSRAGAPQWRKQQLGPKGRKVLIVDDNEDAATCLGMLLSAQGMEVRIANDGNRGLEAVRSFGPAVVLLDLGMPGMSGFEVAQRIRLDPQLSDVCLIALTGWGQPEDRRRSKESGFDHHLVKPIELADLAGLLRDLDLPRSGASSRGESIPLS